MSAMDDLTNGLVNVEGPGLLNIASTPFMVDHVLGTVVVPFISSHPECQIRIVSSIEVTRLVLDNEADIGFVSQPLSFPRLDFHLLFTYDLVLITPHSHPFLGSPVRSIEDIAEWPLIMKRTGTSAREVLKAEFERRKIGYRITVEVETFATVKNYVALGLGVSVIPRPAITLEDRQRLGVVSLGNLLPTTQAGLLVANTRPQAPYVQHFISLAREILRGFGHTTQ